MAVAPEEVDDAINEARLLAKMQSPYVVRYFDSFIDDDFLNIVMEYAEKGTIEEAMKSPISENEIWRIFIQIVLGIYDLHRQKILHRDIKAMNIFLAGDNAVKIGDLGVAKLLGTKTKFARTVVGTPYYMSPELCEGKPYNEKSDVWALGCVLYELCMSGKHPFDASSQAALVIKILRGHYEPIDSAYSTSLKNMVAACLQQEPERRPLTGEILEQEFVQEKCDELQISLPLNIRKVSRMGGRRGESSRKLRESVDSSLGFASQEQGRRRMYPRGAPVASSSGAVTARAGHSALQGDVHRSSGPVRMEKGDYEGDYYKRRMVREAQNELIFGAHHSNSSGSSLRSDSTGGTGTWSIASPLAPPITPPVVERPPPISETSPLSPTAALVVEKFGSGDGEEHARKTASRLPYVSVEMDEEEVEDNLSELPRQSRITESHMPRKFNQVPVSPLDALVKDKFGALRVAQDAERKRQDNQQHVLFPASKIDGQKLSRWEKSQQILMDTPSNRRGRRQQKEEAPEPRRKKPEESFARLEPRKLRL
mmetsp:Transcript_21481/g.55805  ORF Transcript_21481/g.55805 Transcript_21481/m.55805 type:complete len:539 (-) Transcript_21481:89-1705(-)